MNTTNGQRIEKANENSKFDQTHKKITFNIFSALTKPCTLQQLLTQNVEHNIEHKDCYKATYRSLSHQMRKWKVPFSDNEEKRNEKLVFMNQKKNSIEKKMRSKLNRI